MSEVNIKQTENISGSLEKPQVINGAGIRSIEQTSTSTEDNGVNTVTINLTDGTSQTFQVRNGSKGSTGKDGAQGPRGESGVLTVNGVSPDSNGNVEVKSEKALPLSGGSMTGPIDFSKFDEASVTIKPDGVFKIESTGSSGFTNFGLGFTDDNYFSIGYANGSSTVWVTLPESNSTSCVTLSTNNSGNPVAIDGIESLTFLSPQGNRYQLQVNSSGEMVVFNPFGKTTKTLVTKSYVDSLIGGIANGTY